MSKAFVDTTILTDALLKPHGKGPIAKAALASFDESLLPVYAIKEFKSGPLRYFQWFHNKLVVTRSFVATVAALQSISLTPQRYLTATAIEALKEAVASDAHLTTADLQDKYGPEASLDRVLCDTFRDSTRLAIDKAWKRRRSLTTKVTNPLSCYSEVAPYEKDGLLEIKPRKCTPKYECCLGPKLRKRKTDLKTLESTVKAQSDKAENKGRYRILHEMARKPTDSVPEEYCIGLGDAYFALFCPKDAVVITTNLRDHQPLCNALGKTAQNP